MNKSKKLLRVFNLCFCNSIFQMDMPEEFDNWEAENETEFERFVDWYTEPINIINPTKTDYYQYR